MDPDMESAEDLLRRNEALEEALHNLQSKHDQLHEANERITAHCSALAEENSNLRGQHELDDDSSLRDKFQELDFAIRSWCISFRDCKTDPKTALALPVPSQDSNIIYQFKTEAAELTFLISGVWEWLVLLVFDPKPVGNEDDEQRTDLWARKDLWTSESNAVALRYFERKFLKLRQSRKVTMEWRSLTVRLLQQLPDNVESKGASTAIVANKILTWANSAPGTPRRRLGKGNPLRDSLWESVVRNAIEVSLDLRRQCGDVGISVPDNMRPQFTAFQDDAHGHSSTRRARNDESIREDGQTTVCKRPQLYKRRTTTGDDEKYILVDPEQVSIPVYRTIAGDEAIRKDLKARGIFGGRK